MSLPDIELILLSALRTQFPTYTVASVAESVSYGTQIPADLSDRLPFVTIKRIPARQLHPRLATRPIVDIAVWCDNRKAARDLAFDICEYLTAQRAGGVVSSALATNEPFEIRDTTGLDGTTSPAQGIYRFQATYRLVVRTS